MKLEKISIIGVLIKKKIMDYLLKNGLEKQMSGPHSANQPNGPQYTLHMLPNQNLCDLHAVRCSTLAHVVGYDP